MTITIDKEKNTHRGVLYKIIVLYNQNESRGKKQRIVVGRVPSARSIQSTRDSEKLDQSSILPWRDPEPTPLEQHKERVEDRIKSKIDAWKRGLQEAKK